MDMWHLLSGWKSTIMDKGWDEIQMSQWWLDKQHERTNPLDQVLQTEEKRERKREREEEEESFRERSSHFSLNFPVIRLTNSGRTRSKVG